MRSTIILQRDELQSVVDYFMKQDAFCFDVEAYGPQRGVPTQATLNWMSLATYGKAVVIPFGHPNGDRLLSKATRKKNKLTGKFDLIPAVFDAPPDQLRPSEVFSILKPLFFSDRTKIGHNITYDIISSAKYWGEPVPPSYSDTIVLQWLLDENLKQKGLKALVNKYYKVDYDTENVGKCVENYTFSKVARYAYLDAKFTWLLWRKFIRQIEAQGLSGVRRLEEDLIETLVDMGLTGAPIDLDELNRLDVDLSRRIVEVEAEVYRAAGTKFNINATQQKSKILYAPKEEGGQGLEPVALTKGGKKKKESGLPLTYTDYSTDAETLEKYPENPVVQKLTQYQEVNKVLTTYVRSYLGTPEKPSLLLDGRIHAAFQQFGTVSGRFSCKDPNLQNIPRPDTDLGKQIRGLFIAPPGQKLIVADYGQIEIVLLAHFIGHGPLFDGLWEGLDPHAATAARIFGVPVDEVTKAMRQLAKAINFAIIYGAGPEKVAAMAGITVKQAQKFMREHKKLFPEIYRFKDSVISRCKAGRPPHIRTLLGRRRRLPTIWSRNHSERMKAERQAVNSLIQGSAADVVKLAMIRLGNSLPEDMHLILTIHDELVVTCPDDRAELGESLVREAMLGEGIQKLIQVPLTADVKTVDRWSAAK